MKATTSRQVGLERYEALLVELESDQDDGPIVSGSFDLRPDDTGSPTILHLLRQAVREALPADATDGHLERIEAQLADSLGAAASGGTVGAFVAGTFASPALIVAPVRLPPRNRLDIGDVATRFELERSHALVRTSVAIAWAQRGRLLWALTQRHGDPRSGALEADVHYMEDSVGRTGQHGRGGSVDRPAGGHGKTRVERSAEEERDRFARDAAEIIEQELSSADIILLAGAPEFSARLSSQLSAPVRDRFEAVDLGEDSPTTDLLVETAVERGVRAQYERAAGLAADITSGAAGDLAIVGAEAILTAAQHGRLDQLVLHEDAAGHYGDALDARAQAGLADADVAERLLRANREQSGTAWFRRDDAPPPAEALGLLRW